MSEDKMQWMYKGISGIVDREDYLLGRKVDKTFELLEQEEKQQKGDFNVNENDFSTTLFENKAFAANTVTVDLNAKVREDPLYEIRKKQVEERKKIIDNPVKMKRIKQMLEAALKDEESGSESSESSDDRKRRHHSHKHRRRDSRERRSSRERHRSHREHRPKSSERRRHRSKSSERRKRERSPKRYAPTKDEKQSNSKPKKSKLSDEELERRRNEMLQNGAWREDQRRKNVERYKEDEKKESEEQKDKSASFLKPMINSALESDSVEKRIKQKIFKVQREHNAMDKSFARR
ncbi:pre-mRNA-splicing factor CWC25-like protein [Leptotrombidium deliense]|uniref:Pre-mRNA-splicing factor CWC25-like protein n=1 Tax=Leptotrombidium deliense TaxID=299467 RepID=A0A443SIM9_9ACAR|nr:pre-mRNA-splicing factor CWC25-like protein [Leptotrombidium deliense]